MRISKESLYNPFFLVFTSVFLSTLTFTLVFSYTAWEDFWIGFWMSAIIPFIVSCPIAIIMDRYFKRLDLQKQKLEKLDSTNKKLFALISHDVRTPLNNLKTVIDLFNNDNISIEESKSLLKDLSGRLDNVTLFLDGLLDWSKKQTQDKQIEKTPFQTADLIKSILKLMQPQALDKNIEIVTQNINAKIYADIDSYAFVLRNLIHNAIKFTALNGVITINTYEEDNFVYTTIKDTGIGITPSVMDKIINGENWFSTPGTFNELGSGFGIKTCMFYLEKNKGSLSIQSEVGAGSTLTFKLPKARD
ncbi:sensor histidine kinase [Leeuwenhoekiella sp. NPDC079379]|uniref:sensor histidine kinase n=1 Tax=Leeuwenhoekiella sp. NPDC079379 TaxID=3364122 RepID=UPI0037C98B25